MTPETMMDDAHVPTSPKHADLRVVRVPSSPAAARAGTRAIGARSAVLELCSSSFARARVETARNERPSFGRRVRCRPGEARRRSPEDPRDASPRGGARGRVEAARRREREHRGGLGVEDLGGTARAPVAEEAQNAAPRRRAR
jgi:hypothetical protein